MNPVYHPKHISWRSILIVFSHLRLCFPAFFFLQVSSLKPSMHLSGAPYLSHSPQISFSRFDYPNYVWWHFQIMKLHIMQSLTVPCSLVPLKLRYHPQYSIHKYPRFIFLPQCETPIFTLIWNNRQNYSSLYFNVYNCFRYKMWIKGNSRVLYCCGITPRHTAINCDFSKGLHQGSGGCRRNVNIFGSGGCWTHTHHQDEGRSSETSEEIYIHSARAQRSAIWYYQPSQVPWPSAGIPLCRLSVDRCDRNSWVIMLLNARPRNLGSIYFTWLHDGIWCQPHGVLHY